MKELAEEKRKERERKLREIRKKKRKRSYIYLSLLIIVIFLFIVFLKSGFFDLKEVKVIGVKHLKSSEITKLADIPRAINIFQIPVNEIRERILKNPWVKDVELNRHFPRYLEIRVIERKPVALIPFQDQFYLVDEEGYAVALSSNEEKDLPVIRDCEIKSVKIGERPSSPTLFTALVVLTNLDESLKGQINIISASTKEKLSLYTQNGVEILFGGPKEIKKKSFIVQEILKKEGKKVIFIDVRVPSNPVVRRLGS